MEGMSEKMNKQPAAPTLPVSVEKKHQQQQQTCLARPPFLHIVKVVNLWTIYNAVVSFAGGITYYILSVTSPPSQAPWQYTLVSALVMGMLWCSTPQAAAGALALLLPCHRWRLRRAATYAAFAVTVASHCMFAGVVVLIMVSIDPRDNLFFMIVGSAYIFICPVHDLLVFLALLRGEWAH